ncbi:MAG TPA: response regulator [Labilithrix sp.]|nr:response regulator [Labilithrix sp.]
MIFRYGDLAALSGALSETRGSLPLPEGEIVSDGEWVLAIFEIGSRRRATAAAARGVCAAGDPHLEFERRDWERLVGFVTARSEHMKAARSLAPASVVKPIISEAPPVSEPSPRSRRGADLPSSSPIESSRVPFGSRVLVVDDTGDELRAMLAEMGLVVELVATITRAEERINTQSFDALVLDLHAAGSDSRTFVGRLRGDARIADMPVLFLSSKPTSRDVVDAFASGGDDFLPKPFRAPELAARIFGLLRRARMARGLFGSLDR